ncbi:hypothetical protein ACWEQ7_19590 [Streptomyces sp. NPDC004069]
MAADLGINRNTLHNWVLRDRRRRDVDPAAPPAAGKAVAGAGAGAGQEASSSDPDERIRQLEARLRELEASERKLATERDILRTAAK